MRSGNAYQLLAVVVCLCLAGAGWAAQAIIYVDGAATGGNDGSSWTDAYVSLQDALTAAKEAAKPLDIRVAQGTYTPPDRRTPFELLNGVTLKGAYAGVAGADPNARDTTHQATTLTSEDHEIVTGNETDSSAVIDGFTIISPSRWRTVSIDNGSPTFIDCRFVGGSRWPAIVASDCNSVLIACRFEGNAGSGGINCDGGHLTLRDCAFVQNEGRAIGVWGTLDLVRCSFVDNEWAVSWNGTMTARDCMFVGNSGFGAAVSCYGDSTFVDCRFVNNRSTGGSAGALAVRGGNATLTRCLFAGNSNSKWASGAIESYFSVTELRHCLFVGNAGGVRGVTANNPVGVKGPGAIYHFGQILRVSNCTFADNRGHPNTIRYGPLPNSIAELTQCIVRDGPDPFRRELSVTYSNVEGGYEGEGNIDVDSSFVAPGYWDPNGTPDDPNDDVWVMGDYHLKSQAGHWDEETEGWVLDEVTSPCIDLGDPNGPLGAEPFPNGGFVNLGAYGGTSQASRSYFGVPVCETQIAGDINGDCTVDDLDLDILMSHWLMDSTPTVNIPPTVRIYPDVPLADGFDPDGQHPANGPDHQSRGRCHTDGTDADYSSCRGLRSGRNRAADKLRHALRGRHKTHTHPGTLRRLGVRGRLGVRTRRRRIPGLGRGRR